MGGGKVCEVNMSALGGSMPWKLSSPPSVCRAGRGGGGGGAADMLIYNMVFVFYLRDNALVKLVRIDAQ